MKTPLGTTGLSLHNSTWSGIYRAKVLDNNDPDQYGRIKVQAYPMFEGITDPTLLPWAVPMFPIWDGAGIDKGYFAVPDIDTFVFVMFEEGDVYQPIYIGEAPTAQMGLPAERITNYPNRKVIKSSSGIIFYVDDTLNEVKMVHPTGTTITIDNLGQVTISSGTNVNIIGTNVNINP